MKNNTSRNIFLIILGYYLLTGNYKGARNFVIGYVVMILIFGLVVFGIAYTNRSQGSREEAYQRVLQAEQYEKDRQEAEQYAAEVLPVFVKQFKGKTLKGEFKDYSGLDSYGLKFKILNDSILSYQITENEDYSYNSRPKWSKSKKTSYSLSPATNDNGDILKEKLIFKFESYHGQLDVIKSKKKKKKKRYQISTPLTLIDADNIYGTFW